MKERRFGLVKKERRNFECSNKKDILSSINIIYLAGWEKKMCLLKVFLMHCDHDHSVFEFTSQLSYGQKPY